MSERTWPVAEDPDEDTDWAVHLDDDGFGAGAAESEGTLLVFVHIQKTAGKTLRHILRRQYAGRDRSVHMPNFFAKPDLHWSALDELARRRPPGLEVAHGHMLFTPDRWPREARFLTILRDPVERTISHYYWLNERRPVRSQLGSINEAIKQGAIRDNLQVRVLAGADPPGPVTSTMADDAVAALDRFTAVGLTSRFDETLVLFGRAFGWRTAAYERVNSTSSRVPRNALDAATVARIEEHTHYDRALYAVAAERFDELMRAQPDDFRLEVDIVRAAVARTALDARWPEDPIVLSTEGMDPRALLVSAEASRLASELDRQRLIAATRQIGVLQSERQSSPRVASRSVDQNADEALSAALARIDELEIAQRGAKRKIARARKRRGGEDLMGAAPAPKKQKRPPDPTVERKPKPARAERLKATRAI